nr:MAG TPA_asm: hypothetical protein [Caudoviricetes sp.]DAR26782.1 MAG TPA: hypothetical protein [Caudoviricetes sp.]
MFTSPINKSLYLSTYTKCTLLIDSHNSFCYDTLSIVVREQNLCFILRY